MKYKCLETFDLPAVDEEGIEIDEIFEVIEGSIWFSKQPITESDTDIELFNEKGDWLSISREEFDSMFEVAEG
ncbi:hypothetical protein A5804_002097 [Enterococcus faecium]|uniref:Uncharacterized protein n=1 Tax=Enterococcus faecium TaxID=1352 RepID=A0AB73NAX1_ENTFC|nr:hypothetical protein [Enterococcus faecium]EME8274700.1 hypothetical protein [Enterococcus faecium]OTO00585.1 hypothetical protein A5804_002097 [Enterococcus faecium]